MTNWVRLLIRLVRGGREGETTRDTAADGAKMCVWCVCKSVVGHHLLLSFCSSRLACFFLPFGLFTRLLSLTDRLEVPSVFLLSCPSRCLNLPLSAFFKTARVPSCHTHGAACMLASLSSPLLCFFHGGCIMLNFASKPLQHKKTDHSSFDIVPTHQLCVKPYALNSLCMFFSPGLCHSSKSWPRHQS